MKTPSCFVGVVLAMLTACEADQTNDYAQQLFNQLKSLVVRSERSRLCLERGVGVASTLAFSNCGSDLDRKSFVYDQVSGELLQPATANCVDFGSFDSPTFRTQVCNTDSTTQKFAFDLATGHIMSAAQPTLCLDSKTDAPQLVTCNATEPSQVFGVVATTEVETNSATYVTTVNGTRITVPDVFLNQQPFLLAGKHKSNLCLSDGGAAQLNGNTTFEMATCGADTSAQTFVFDRLTLQIRSIARQGLCINDGKGLQLPPFLHLEKCTTGHKNQQWVLDPSSSQLLSVDSVLQVLLRCASMMAVASCQGRARCTLTGAVAPTLAKRSRSYRRRTSRQSPVCTVRSWIP